MNRTRIEIQTSPADLPAPHFDDEATIVSARPVVPIAQAKAVERSRAILWILPFVLIAAVFGALGALGTNYYEHRQGASVDAIAKSSVSQGSEKNQAMTSQTPDSSSATSEKSSAESTGADSAIALPAPPNSTTEDKAGVADQNNSTDATAVFPKESANAENPTPTKNANDAISRDPGRLVRKRRVHPSFEPSDAVPFDRKKPNGKRGAGRIQEIFQGSNP